jgi:hypothetical protein
MLLMKPNNKKSEIPLAAAALSFPGCARAIVTPPSPPFPTGKMDGDEVFGFATWPVGPGPPIGGMSILPVGGLTAVTFVTTLPADTPKRVAVLVPWFEVQKGLVSV